jgi:hypothetical protein
MSSKRVTPRERFKRYVLKMIAEQVDSKTWKEFDAEFGANGEFANGVSAVCTYLFDSINGEDDLCEIDTSHGEWNYWRGRFAHQSVTALKGEANETA